jgi:hypothetical protein
MDLINHILIWIVIKTAVKITTLISVTFRKTDVYQSSNKGHTGATEGKRNKANKSLCIVRQKKVVEMPLASNSTSSYQI